MKKRLPVTHTERRIVTKMATLFADRPFRSLVYAITLELTEVFLFLIAIGLSAEVLAPGIITSRLSPLPVLVCLVVLIAISILFGRSIRAPFPYIPNRRDSLTWIGIVWIAFLLTMLSARVSPFLAPFIIGPFFFGAMILFRFLRKKQRGSETGASRTEKRTKAAQK